MTGLRSGGFAAVLASTVLAFGGYALLLPVVPLHAVAGGASPGGGGATTGVFMAATVATQLLSPPLLRRAGPRASMLAGCVALGAPAALMVVSASVLLLLAVAVLRGIGFGLVTVTGAVLVADLVAPAVRGRAIGIYGFAVGFPQLVLLGGGVWGYAALGPTVVLLLGAALPLAAVPLCVPLPARGVARPDAPERSRAGVAPGPILAMIAAAAAAGGVITVLPLWAAGSGAGAGLAGGATLAASALVALTVGQLAGRYLGGELADRPALVAHRPVVTVTGLVLVAGGAVTVAAAGDFPVLVGAAAIGFGFGAVQSDTLLTLFARGRSETASAWWNAAYDAGTGLGAAVLAAVLGAAGGSPSFVVAAGAAVLVAVGVVGAGVRRRGSLPPTA